MSEVSTQTELKSDELVTIEGELRQETGKGACRKLRAQGKVPANILGATKTTMISLNPKWLSKAWKSGKEFNLLLEGVTKRVRIHELQINAVKRSPVHVDLRYV